MSSRLTDTVALKKAMIEKGVERISDLSKASGVCRNTLSGVLRGNAQPSADVMGRLITTLEIQPAQAGEIFFSVNLHDTQVKRRQLEAKTG